MPVPVLSVVLAIVLELLALTSREELRARDEAQVRELTARLQELRVMGMQRVREAHEKILRGRGDELPKDADTKTVREGGAVYVEVLPAAPAKA